MKEGSWELKILVVRENVYENCSMPNVIGKNYAICLSPCVEVFFTVRVVCKNKRNQCPFSQCFGSIGPKYIFFQNLYLPPRQPSPPLPLKNDFLSASAQLPSNCLLKLMTDLLCCINPNKSYIISVLTFLWSSPCCFADP